MSELDNKIRLNQARRDVAKERVSRADGNRSEKGLYGGSKVAAEEKKRKNSFKGVKNPIAAAKKAKNIATAPTEFRFTDVAVYGVAFSLAALKDLLDLAFVGSLPAIGTVITFCISIAIGFVLLFDGISSSRRKIARRMTRRYLMLIAGTISEAFLFGLNFFPFEVATVAIIYWMSLVDRKAEK